MALRSRYQFFALAHSGRFKITNNNILSYSLIKLPRFHKLSVGAIFTDKPQIGKNY